MADEAGTVKTSTRAGDIVDPSELDDRVGGKSQELIFGCGDTLRGLPAKRPPNCRGVGTLPCQCGRVR